MDEYNFALLLFRVVIGLSFAAHGYGKLFQGGRIDGTAGWFDSMGMRPGKMHAWAAALTEVGAGLLLAVGLLTSFAGAGIVGVMIVAGYTVHRDNGFFIVKEGWEYTFVLAMMGIVAAMLGAGEWSVDEALGIVDDLNGWTGLAISAGLGGAAGVGTLAAFYRPNAT